MFNVLFVCTGNICRSPTAHGIFAQMVKNKGLDQIIGVDSAGIISYHQGQAPDDRATRTALKNGVDIRSLRARMVEKRDFSNFDLIVAMAEDHYEALSVLQERFANTKAKLCKMMDFAPQYQINSVPDPYYGSGDGFQTVFDMVHTACEGLLNHIERDILNAGR
ncbi:MAG: low molecular weight phosphotyrosine protein phosphatase [Alphaproteobacteria bacterium]|nr:low molecular weight phosphotyrosine protein phosphatase [Alphaproteobacteria bacterium]